MIGSKFIITWILSKKTIITLTITMTATMTIIISNPLAKNGNCKEVIKKFFDFFKISQT